MSNRGKPRDFGGGYVKSLEALRRPQRTLSMNDRTQMLRNVRHQLLRTSRISFRMTIAAAIALYLMGLISFATLGVYVCCMSACTLGHEHAVRKHTAVETLRGRE
ncbi:MAG: hypothetical protein R3C05_16615 [Pirellulaceae bacterium]